MSREFLCKFRTADCDLLETYRINVYAPNVSAARKLIESKYDVTEWLSIERDVMIVQSGKHSLV